MKSLRRADSDYHHSVSFSRLTCLDAPAGSATNELSFKVPRSLVVPRGCTFKPPYVDAADIFRLSLDVDHLELLPPQTGLAERSPMNGTVELNMASLTRLKEIVINGARNIARLNLSKTAVKTLTNSILSELPVLAALTLRSMPHLIQIENLGLCDNLQKVEMQNSRRLREIKSLPRTPKLFIDAHDCISLNTSVFSSVQHVEWNTVPLQCPRGHFVVHYIMKILFPGCRCDLCHSETEHAYCCRACDFLCCKACYKRKTHVPTVAIVWPHDNREKSSVQQLRRDKSVYRQGSGGWHRSVSEQGPKAFTANAEPEKEKIARIKFAQSSTAESMALEGVHQKLINALKGNANSEAKTLKEELTDALERAAQANVLEPSILLEHSATLVSLDVQYDFACPHGCGATFPPKELESHVLTCEFYTEQCPVCQLKVRTADIAHHQEVENNLLAAMQSWNIEPLRKAVAESRPGHCRSCWLRFDLLSDSDEMLRDLETKLRRSLHVLNKGNVGIDFDLREIRVLKDIPFEPRDEPDSSAAFAPEGLELVKTILDNLAVVVKNFGSEGVTIEVPVGGDSDFLREVAINKATLICQCLTERQIPERLCKPKHSSPDATAITARPVDQCKAIPT